MLAALLANFERVMTESANPQKKHLLHRLVKKVLVHDRRTLEVWYGLPNRQGFADCNKWLPECNSMRTGRRGPAEPEIWFRIVHITLEDTAGSVAYREQKVEIALGPKGAFENGNIGILTRKVPAGQVVSAVPPPRGKPKPPKVPRTPSAVEFLRKALEWRALLNSGEAKSQSDIARQEGISRVRVCQVLCLLRLAPELQQQVLAMPDTIRRSAVTERALRPIALMEDFAVQSALFQELRRHPRQATAPHGANLRIAAEDRSQACPTGAPTPES